MTALLEVENLTVRFPMPKEGLFGPRPYLEAVRSVSFQVEEGKALGIVGESGSGKTTTAMATIRLEDAADGAVRFQGNDLLSLDDEGMRAARRDVQLIFQDPYSSLNPRARVSHKPEIDSLRRTSQCVGRCDSGANSEPIGSVERGSGAELPIHQP